MKNRIFNQIILKYKLKIPENSKIQIQQIRTAGRRIRVV
jgi:hypothetical protein